jgi:hypothetical protein
VYALLTLLLIHRQLKANRNQQTTPVEEPVLLMNEEKLLRIFSPILQASLVQRVHRLLLLI